MCMSEIGDESQGSATFAKENEKSHASRLYAELRGIQADPIKAAITGLNIGSAYYPQPNGGLREVYVKRFASDPRNIPLWKQRGFTDQDINSGLSHLHEAEIQDPNSIYDRRPGTLNAGELVKEVWVSGTGKVLRQGTSLTSDWENDELEPHHVDAIDRINRLSQIPFKIKETFGTYEAFKEQLGKVDTNGLDRFFWSTDKERPWIPFLLTGQLPGFVNAVRLAETMIKIDPPVENT